MSCFLFVINLSLPKADVMLVARGSTTSNGSSESAIVGVCICALSAHLAMRSVDKEGNGQLGRRKLVSSTSCCHSASAITPNAKWHLNNNVPPLECLPGCPMCSPVGMQQKYSCYHATSSNVNDLHDPQPCSGKLSSGKPYSTLWGMACLSEPLMDTLGLFGSYPSSSDPN